MEQHKKCCFVLIKVLSIVALVLALLVLTATALYDAGYSIVSHLTAQAPAQDISGVMLWQKYDGSSTHRVATKVDSLTLYPGTKKLTYSRHADQVNTVALFPDGSRIASASNDGTVQVWYATAGHHIFTYMGHSGGGLAITWSLGATHLASGGTDWTVQVWNPSAAGTLNYSGHSGAVEAIAWSSDGQHLASGSDDMAVWVWDLSPNENYVYPRASTRTGTVMQVFTPFTAPTLKPDGYYTYADLVGSVFSPSAGVTTLSPRWLYAVSHLIAQAFVVNPSGVMFRQTYQEGPLSQPIVVEMHGSLSWLVAAGMKCVPYINFAHCPVQA